MQTKLIQFFIFIFSFLFCLFSLLGCDKFEEYQRNKAERIKQEKIERNKRVEREIVERAKKFSRKANINGVPVVLPSGVGGLEIDGDPPFLSPKKRETPRSDSSYENSVRSFGFEFEFKRNVMRGRANYEGYVSDNEYAKDFGNPQSAWVRVILSAGEESPSVTNLTMNKLTYKVLRQYLNREWYSQTGELFGLELHQVPNQINPEKGKSFREDYMWGDDVFIQRDKNGDVITLIKCHNVDISGEGKKFLKCLHRTQLSDLDAWLELYYLRVHLEYWQEIQQLAEEHIRSWIVEPKQVQ